MSSMDFNLAKFNIPIRIQRAFDKGKISESYRQMYIIAEKLAVAEANQLLAQKRKEYLYSKLVSTEGPGAGAKSKITEIEREGLEYKNQRLEYHMNTMVRMLEMYVTHSQKK